MTTQTTKAMAFLAALLVGHTTAPSAVQADSIHRQIQKHVPQVVDYLQKKGVKTVGVLKFRVKKPGEKTTDSAGSVNSLLADRLEVALILGNSFKESQQLQIIKDASGQVAKIKGANHLTAEGRAAMFAPEYKLAWGEVPAKADAFLTGVVAVHDDNTHATVGVLCFHKTSGKLERVGDVFVAELDASTLGEMGESFVLRGAFDGGSSQLTFKDKQQQRQQRVKEQVASVRNETAKFPLSDSAAPVKLTVLYDGRPVPIKIEKGRAFVPEPVTGQKVEFSLARTSAARGRLAIVLRVNGENTLFRQTKPDIECNKWILDPNDKPIVIRGYQTKQNTAEQFKVLSRSESAQRAMDYGRNVGLIQLTVFQELSGPKPTPNVVDEGEEDLLAMMRGTQPSDTPGNLGALKRQIRLAGRGEQMRGIMVQGAETESKTRTVAFVADPTPAMSVTIRYYTP